MIELPLADSLASGSTPRRPTMVMRASCWERVVENVRRLDGRVDALRRIGERRKDIVVVVRGWKGEVAARTFRGCDDV